jgi:hypothetical protein
MGPPFDLAAARYVRHEVDSKTGDLDIFQGPAHELAIALPNFREASLDEARVHTSAVGRVTFDRDITDWLGEQLSAGLLEVEELLALLRGELDDASPVLVISPAELPPVGGEVRSSDGRASGDRQPMRASER